MNKKTYSESTKKEERIFNSTITKQEKLEEAAEKYATNHGMMLYVFPEKREAFIAGAKWQSERMYSEEEVLELLEKRQDYMNSDEDIFDYQSNKEWFKQNKKK